ncbi:ubiquitin carboxyl-terminal hydrolase 7 [Paramuricea clavata]|uniref:Ubiquitin carboxyl-terminal hydrolase 7 n=1 Tax=Paramuricea clavata TaxID=317549 RepID=A0A6S7I521_PARCT|nr:ubiquitin carboxyl-terminal hydrolase 7 [Paramuricea clavata]
MPDAGLIRACFNTIPESWSCKATAQLVLVNQLLAEKSFKKEIKHRFFAKENDWGFSIFKNWNEILNTENGFLVNDTIIVEAHVVAEAPHGVA